MRYLVIDHPFNRAWYPRFIGKILSKPPAFVIVKEID